MSLGVVWFKRDLRLLDHAPLKAALSHHPQVLLLYVFEPSVLAQPDFSDRHGQFIVQSIRELQLQLQGIGWRITVLMGEMISILESLQANYKTIFLYSHEETGNEFSWKRDKLVLQWCSRNKVEWREFPTNGVVRRLKKKPEWAKIQKMRLALPEETPDWSHAKPIKISSIETMFSADGLDFGENPSMQRGGELQARQCLNTFLENRHRGYRFHLSKPEGARTHGSRLSPYLAWGNLSLKQVFNAMFEIQKKQINARDLASFRSRLYWHDHFCQKLETMQTYEHRSMNPGMDAAFVPWNQGFHDTWASGHTGYPLIDACMRCLIETGFLNFRMRAMLVAFHSYHLRLYWKPAAIHLARLFLDYDPGIHYPQMQMQAGTCGYHTFRIYNPTLQAKLHDPQAVFIKKWVSELTQLPVNYCFEPWKMTSLEQSMYQFEIGKDYPFPIVDIEKTGIEARKTWWGLANEPHIKAITTQLLSAINRPPKGFDQDEEDDQ